MKAQEIEKLKKDYFEIFSNKNKKDILNEKKVFKSDIRKLFLDNLDSFSNQDLEGFIATYQTKAIMKDLFNDFNFAKKMLEYSLDKKTTFKVDLTLAQTSKLSKESIIKLAKINRIAYKLSKDYERIYVTFNDCKAFCINNLKDEEDINKLIELAYKNKDDRSFFNFDFSDNYENIKDKKYCEKAHSKIVYLNINEKEQTAKFIRYCSKTKAIITKEYSFVELKSVKNGEKKYLAFRKYMPLNFKENKYSIKQIANINKQFIIENSNKCDELLNNDEIFSMLFQARVKFNFSIKQAKELLKKSSSYYVKTFTDKLQMQLKNIMLDYVLDEKEQRFINFRDFCEELFCDFDFYDEYLTKRIQQDKQRHYSDYIYHKLNNCDKKLLNILKKHNIIKSEEPSQKEKIIISFSNDTKSLIVEDTLEIDELINLAYIKEFKEDILYSDLSNKQNISNLIINDSLNIATLIRYDDTSKTTEKLVYSFKKAAI